MKKAFKWVGIAVLVLLTAVIGYVAYVYINYDRIADNKKIDIEGTAKKKEVEVSTDYSVATYNIGYGAYSRDYTFFMDGGKESKAYNKEEVLKNIKGSTDIAYGFNPDFMLFQEVDIDATRSYHVNEEKTVKNKFSDMEMAKAINYDSSFLLYPVFDPIGKSKSEIISLSKYKMENSIRRSLPISKGFNKFFDLDRCYIVTEINVSNGKKLYLYNVHLSAYGADPSVRDQQMEMLFKDMKEKQKADNYVICGGDFNHDFTGNSVEIFNGKNTDGGEWAQPFPEKYLENTFIRATNYGGQVTPTSRNNDIPYEKGKSTVMILDGFIVSENVKIIEVNNIDTDFKYTDHMPVLMKFKLI